MFSWKPFYTELASKLLENKNRHKELVEFVYSSLEFTNYLRMENGDKIKDIDPFSFFGIFNRKVGDEYRRANLRHIKEYFQILSNVPDDFDGIPILDARNSFFYQWHDENTLLQSCDLLWKIFESGVNGTVTEEELSEFVKLDGVGISSATIGLFWINPDYYMPMDGNSKKYLGDLGLNCKKVDASSYLSVLAEIKHKMGTKEIQEQTLVEISRKAWQLGKGGEIMDMNFWSGGIKWGEVDKFQEFKRGNYWQIGWDRTDESRGANKAWANIAKVKVGDFISFHGYGGRNNLVIYQISRVKKVDVLNGKLYSTSTNCCQSQES